MILAVILCVICFAYWVFSEGALIDSLRDLKPDNEEIKEYIKRGRYNVGAGRTYNKKDLNSAFKIIRDFILSNLFTGMISFILALVISAVVSFFYNPLEEYNYSFNIDSLKDNIATSGEIRGGIFCMSGYIDGEINYYYSRKTDNGYKIEHIPSSNTYVKYDNNEKPKVTVYRERSTYPKWYNQIFFDCGTDTFKYYTITVPEGTIVSNGTYEIDMN